MIRPRSALATMLVASVMAASVIGVGIGAAGAADGCRRGQTSDCVGADLSRRDLRGWDFRRSDLRGANLTRSDLRGVDLRGARLDRVNATRTDLRGADLRRTRWLTGALEGADLRRVRLDRAQFSAARLGQADLRDARFGLSFWTDADLTDARVDVAALPAVGLCDTVLPDGAVATCGRALTGTRAAKPRPVSGSPRLVVDLTRLVIRLVQRDRLNPPVASRVYALSGIALLETAQPNALPLRDLEPIPAGPRGLDDRTVAASGAPLVPRALSEVPSTRAAFAAFRDEALAAAADRVSAPRFRASVRYGQGVATRLVEWSERDGFAATRTRPYVAPTGPGLWVPTPPTFQAAQEPAWGGLRPYVVTDASECAAPPPPEYSTDPGSEFMAQERAVYETARALTRDQRAIARFWNDDRGHTGTPGGHWVATANIAIDRRDLSFGDAARLQGAVGASVGDAFITAWASKYRWNQIRPVTVIRDSIDSEWEPYLNTPPFPDWVSGHATVSGAAARTLTELVGPMAYRDAGFSTGSDVRASFSIRPRRFRSFMAAAEQAAKSREYGGIHIPNANTAGLAVGECVARMVVGGLVPSPDQRARASS